MKSIILTGSTGIFGKLLFDDLFKSNCNITLLIRADSQKEAEARATELLKTDPRSSSRVCVLRGDLNQVNLGLVNQVYSRITANTTHILHAAASTEFTLPIKYARRNNVEATRNLLNFAKDCKNLQRFGFVSTAFVAGKRSGLILEEDFEHNSGFLNTYEESKYEAEMLVRSMIKILPVVIFRPSLIVAPYNKLSISPISALILGLILTSKGLLPLLPGKENHVLDIIEGTVASQAITQIFVKETLAYSTYHVTSAGNSPTLKDLVALIDPDKNLSIRFCGDLKHYTDDLNELTRSRPALISTYKKTQTFLPELAMSKIFDNKNLLREIGVKSFSSYPIVALQSLMK